MFNNGYATVCYQGMQYNAPGQNQQVFQPDPNWLLSPEGQAWLSIPSGQDWLFSPQGQEWLFSPQGQEWQFTPGGKKWLASPLGKMWQENCNLKLQLSQPPITEAKKSVHNQNYNESENATIFIDYYKNAMIERTEKYYEKNEIDLTLHNFSLIPSNVNDDIKTACSSYSRTLTNGIVEVASVFVKKIGFSTHSHSFVKLKITDSNRVVKYAEISAEDINNNKTKKLREFLSDNGVILKYPGKATLIRNYLLEEFNKFSKKAEVRNEGFYVKDGYLHHSDEEEITRNASDASNLLDTFGLKDEANGNPPYLNLALLGIGCISSVLSPLIELGHKQMPLIVLTNANHENAAAELIKILCGTKPILLAKGFEENLATDKTSLFVFDAGLSDYKAKTLLGQIAKYCNYSFEYAGEENKVHTLPVLVAPDAKPVIATEALEDRFIELPYTSTTINQDKANRVFSWFQERCINQQNVLPGIIGRENELKEKYLESYGLPDFLQNFYSLLLATVEKVLLLTHYDESRMPNIIKGFVDYLLYASEKADSADILRDLLKECSLIPQLSVGTEIAQSNTICYSDNEIFITTSAMKEIAESNGMTQTEFAKRLKSDGLLNCGDKYQKNVRVSDGTARFYAVPLDKLYGIGEVRIQPDEFSDKSPDIKPHDFKVPIGKCGDVQIYYKLSDLKGTDNPHTLILGPSGSGKSNFLMNFCAEAAKNDIAVISIGTEATCLKDEKNGICVNYRDVLVEEKKITYSTIIEPLWSYKDWNDTELDYLKMLSEETQEFDSAEACIECCREYFSDDAGGEKIISRIDSAHCCGVYSMAKGWNQICKPHKVVSIIVDEDNNDCFNAVLESLFKYKSTHKKSTPCLLVVDECRSFDLKQRSPLVNKILCQGRKFGIMAFFASQFLNSKDSNNIDDTIRQFDTIIAFKPGDNTRLLRLVGYSSEDKEARNVISGIDKPYCVVKGRIATDKCRIKYPLIVKIPKMS